MNLSRRFCALSLPLIACATPAQPPAPAPAPVPVVEVAPVASAHPPTAQEIALTYLLRARRYTGAAVGEGADTPHEIHALTLLLAAKDLSPLQRLVREGSPVGRVFGLLGLDEPAYQAAFAGLREDQDSLTTFFGCVLAESTVAAQARELDEERPASSAEGGWWLPRGPWWAAPDPGMQEEGLTAAEWLARLEAEPDLARDALSALGRDALPALVVGLSAERVHLRIECIELLARLGPLALEAAPNLASRLEAEPDPLVRTEAAGALWALGPWALTVEPALTTAVNDRALAPETRIAAWRALSPRRGDLDRGQVPAPLDLVEVAVLDPAEHVCEWGRGRLVARWPAPDAHAVALRVISAEPDGLLRRDLVEELLYAHAKNDDPATRQRARELQERLTKASAGEVDRDEWAGRVKVLLDEASDPVALLELLDAPRAQLSAVDAALADAPRPVLDELLQAARSPRLVALCARLLAHEHGADAIDPLTRRLEREADPRLRYLLAEALRQANGGR